MHILCINQLPRATRPPYIVSAGAYIIFDVSIDFIVLFLSFALHCCLGFAPSLYRTLVRDALYASSRPLLEQRLTRARRQLLICGHCSVVYLWPFLSCKTVKNGCTCTSWYAFQYMECLPIHMFAREAFVAAGNGRNDLHDMHILCIDQLPRATRPPYIVSAGGYIILDVSIDFIALFLSFALH